MNDVGLGILVLKRYREVCKALALSGCEMRGQCGEDNKRQLFGKTTSIEDVIGPPITRTHPICWDAPTKE